MTYLLFFHERMEKIYEEHQGDFYGVDPFEDIQLAYEEETGERVPARFRIDDLDGKREKRLEYARSILRQNRMDESTADWRNSLPSSAIIG